MRLLLLLLVLPACSLFSGPDVGPARAGVATLRRNAIDKEAGHENLADAFKRAVEASNMAADQKQAYLVNIEKSVAAMRARTDNDEALLDSIDAFLVEVGTTNKDDLEAAFKELYKLYKEVRRQ